MQGPVAEVVEALAPHRRGRADGHVVSQGAQGLAVARGQVGLVVRGGDRLQVRVGGAMDHPQPHGPDLLTTGPSKGPVPPALWLRRAKPASADAFSGALPR